MDMNFFELKSRSKAAIRESKPNILTVALLYILLMILVDYIITNIFGYNHIRDSEFQTYMTEGNYEYAQIYLSQYMKPTPLRISSPLWQPLARKSMPHLRTSISSLPRA